MPRSASWLERFADLEAIPDPLIDRAAIERILQVSPRRAQQIMEHLPGKMVGTSKLVWRTDLLDRLRALSRGEAAEFEMNRRERMAKWIDDQARERLERPQLLVEAPVSVVNTRIEQLPAGVTIDPGRITVSCDSAPQALERLLALCMAIGNDPDKFSQLVEPS